MKKITGNKKIFLVLLFLVCVLVGFANVFEHILNANALAREGKPYYPYFSAEHRDMIYGIGTKIRDILDGHVIISDTFTYEYKNFPYFSPPVTPILFFPFKFFVNTVDQVMVASCFVFPAIFCLLFFILYYIISKKKWLSLFFAVFTSLYPYFSIHFPPPGMIYLKSIFNTLLPFTGSPEAHFIGLYGSESRVPTLVPFLLGLIFIYLALTKEKRVFAILAGLFYALNAYCYPYHFIYISASLGVLFVFLLIGKNKRALKQMIILFLSALLLLIPFFINQIELRSLPQYTDVFSRWGVEIGRSFRWGHWERYLWTILLSVIIIFWGIKKDKKIISYFVASFLLSTILALNMQLLLGFAIQSDHWSTRDFLWGFNLAYFILIWYFVDYLKNKHGFFKYIMPIFAVFLLVSLFVNYMRVSLDTSKENYKYYTMSQDIINAHEWLNKNTPVDSVVVTPSLISNYIIPHYTHNNVFIPNACLSITPEDEALERLYIVYRIFNIDDKYLDRIINPAFKSVADESMDKKSFDNYETDGAIYLLSDKYVAKDLDFYAGGSKELPLLTQEVYTRIMDGYKNFICSDCLKKYRMDYVFYGPREKNIIKIDLSKNKFLRKIYDSDGVEIYEINFNELKK